MSRWKRPGKYQFCVQLGLDRDQTAFAQHQQLTRLAPELIAVFDRFQLPATWAVTSSMLGCLLDQRLSCGHEVALLADHTWLPDRLTKRNLLQHIDEQRQAADDLGLTWQALVSRDTELRDHANTLFAAEFRVLGTQGVFPARRPWTPQPGATVERQAILCIAPSATFPGCGRWLGAADPGFAAKKTLLRAIRLGVTEHLRIDAAGMLANPAGLIKSLSRVLGHAARLRDAGRLTVETIAQAATRSCPASGAPSSHSILRPAA